MNTLTGVIGFGVIVFSVLLMVVLSAMHRRSRPAFRSIPAFINLRQAINHVVENGTRLHVSLGHSALTKPQAGSALAGLTLLRRLAELTSASDRPPIASSGEATLALLSQDTLQGASHSSARGSYDPTEGRLTGLTPFSYAAGAVIDIRDENISANVLMGNFGVEAALLTDAAERADAFMLAGSDNLAAQAVIYASAQEPLIGEELFAAGAYTDSGPMHNASLVVQDILRWLIVLVILSGALLKLAGVW